MERDGGTRWSAQAADLIQWFNQRRAELPATPFPLNAWTHVSDPSIFYAALEQNIARPTEYAGGRARRGFGRPLRLVVEAAWS
jgi:hypothetical protein